MLKKRHVPVASHFFEKRTIFSQEIDYPIIEIGIFEFAIDFAPFAAGRNAVASENTAVRDMLHFNGCHVVQDGIARMCSTRLTAKCR